MCAGSVGALSSYCDPMQRSPTQGVCKRNVTSKHASRDRTWHTLLRFRNTGQVEREPCDERHAPWDCPRSAPMRDGEFVPCAFAIHLSYWASRDAETAREYATYRDEASGTELAYSRGPFDTRHDAGHAGGESQDRMEGLSMQWTTPSFSDMRFGFEITMYIATR
jgi:coenzyme PQQ precursor peptide PqqA